MAMIWVTTIIIRLQDSHFTDCSGGGKWRCPLQLLGEEWCRRTAFRSSSSLKFSRFMNLPNSNLSQKKKHHRWCNVAVVIYCSHAKGAPTLKREPTCNYQIPISFKNTIFFDPIIMQCWNVQRQVLCISGVRKLPFSLYWRVALCLMGPCSLATPYSQWRFAVQSDVELPRPTPPLLFFLQYLTEAITTVKDSMCCLVLLSPLIILKELKLVGDFEAFPHLCLLLYAIF